MRKLKNITTLCRFILLGVCLSYSPQLFAQGCDPTTPTFTINLSGNPDSTWTSTAVERMGNCCGTTAPDKCIEFLLTLDSNSSGIRLDIPTGALPGGALFYQIGCGTSYQVGLDICLSGPGPHRITFCKPGNNVNTYQIKAIPKPDLKGRLVINEACIGHLKAMGLVTSSITWQSVPNNATHNSYLSCLSACDSVSIIPSGAYPPTVTYRVCGTVAGGCGAAATFCDTATVRFVTNTDVDIKPKNPTVCFGGTNATITANPVGGLAPFRYLWNTGDTSQSISVGVGTYHVQMLDSLGCTLVRDTVTVTSFASAIDAHAGNDTSICRNAASVFLTGSTQGGVGGIWKGGLGTYAPNDTTLNATYVPHISEITSGTINLRLVTTRNGSCPADSDAVNISVQIPSPTSITGPNNVCAHKTSSYSTTRMSGSTYSWNITGGTITSTINDTLINVLWGTAGIGTITLRQVNTFGCDSVVEKTITINPTPVPVLSGPNAVCERKTTTYTARFVAGATYVWNVTGGTITSTLNDTLINVLWGVAGAGTVSVRQTNTFSCDSTVVKDITINPTPVTILSGPNAVCERKTTTFTARFVAGATYVWNVTGGTITSTLNDTLINVLWGVAGVGTVSVRQTNTFSCDSTVMKNITINPTPVPILNGPNAVCERKTTTYTARFVTGATYVWNVTGGAITSTLNDTLINVLWGAAGVGTVSVRQTNTFSCDSTIIKNITINPTPVPVLSGPNTVCERKTTTFTIRFVAGATYMWNVTGGAITSTLNDTLINVLWGAAGVGTVSVRQTNTFSCDSTVIKNITINPTPVPVLSGPNAVCERKTTAFTARFVAGATYVWNVTGGTITSTLNDTLINVLWGVAGFGTVSVRQTNTFSCDSTVSKNIVINPTPVPVLSGPNAVCERKTSTYTARYAIEASYVWNVTGGSITATLNDTLINVLWGNTGVGTVSVKQTNPYGCDSTVIKNITINPTPVPILSGPNAVCERKTTTFTARFVTGATYVWNVTGGTITSTLNDTLINVLWGVAGVGTVSVRQTNTFSCDSTVIKNITINPTPVPILSGPNAVCEFTSTNYSARFVAGASYVWNVTGGTITSTLNDTLINVLWGVAGAGTVSVRQTNTFGCDSTVIKNISIHGRPVATITGDTNICERNSRQYFTNSTANATYNWGVINGAITATNDTMITINWPTSGQGMVQLVKTNQYGCDTSAALPTVIIPRPLPFIQGDNIVCRYKTKLYNTNARPLHTYKWFVNGGTILGTDTDTLLRVNWTAETTGKVILIVTNELGCDTVEIKDITINPTPTPIIIGNNATCANKQYAYSTTFATGNIYTWTVIGGTINNNRDSIINVTWKDTAAGTVTLRITNVHGCDSTVSLPVVVTPTPVALISGGNIVCAYRTETYTANTVNVATYKWTVNNGTVVGVDTNATVNIKWSNQPTGQVTLRVVSVAGCDSSITFNVTIRPSPIPEIIGPDSVCQNTAYWYRSAYTPTNNYIWTCDGGSIISNNDSAVLVRWGNSGIGMVRLLEATLLGCDSLDFIHVTIINKPTPVIVGPQILCEKTKGIYSVKKSANTLWQSNGGVISNINDTTIEVNWNTNGNFIVFVTQRNSFGCDTTISYPVTVNPKPIVTIIGPDNVCQYSTHKWFTQRNGITYQWNISGGNIISATNDTVVTAKMSNQPFAALQLRVVNNFGCDTTVYKNITLRNAPSAPITGDSIVCSNVTSYTYSTIAEVNHSYLWQATTGLILNNNNESSAFVNWSRTGFNTLSLYVINNNTGCDTTLYKTIYVDSVVKPIINLNRAFGCVPFQVSFSADNTNGLGYQYNWNFDNGNTSTTAKQNITYQTAGNFNVRLIVTNKNGCKDTANAPVVGNKRPIASADYVRTSDRIYVEEDTVQFINNSVGGNKYIWEIVTIKTDTAFETASSFSTPGRYKIKLAAKDTLTGCEDSTSLFIDVRVRENVYVPTAFTPNGDGSNDFFKIGIENITAFEVIIVNRWGEIVYTSTDPRFEWDGTYKGQPCQTDTYVYLVNATGFHGKNFSIKGNVTLLR